MPGAIDPSLPGGGLPIDHDPTNRVGYNTVPAGMPNLFDLIEQVLGSGIETLVNTVVEVIESLTGLVFSSAVGFINSIISALMSAPTFIFQIFSQLIGGVFGMLFGGSPLNAEQLYNQAPPEVLGFIPFTAIGEGNPNLLANPSFVGAESVQGGKMWFWDDTVGLTSPGSVYCVANGQLKQLRSNPIPVSINQELDISIGSMWNGLVYTGTPIRVQVVRFLNGVEQGVDSIASPTAPPLNQSTWLKIGHPKYVIPGGCDAICIQLAVSSTATAGTIRFDDGDVHKTGSSAVFVPPWNVGGIGGPVNLGETVFSIFNAYVGGLVGVIGGIGAGLADMFGIGQDISSRASLGMYSWQVLGVRNNKPIDQGLLATSNSNFSLGRVAMQSSAPTIPVTQAVSAIGFLRMAESNDKGVVSWLGYGNANITGCYVNIWKMNPVTGDMTLAHRSPNLVSSLSGGTVPQWVIYDYPDDMLPTVAGELYGVEITVVGSGTHTVAGTTTWLPPHPSSFPKTYAATRNSGTGTPAIGTVIPSASVQYATNIPWIEWGIVVEPGFGSHPDEITQFTEAGTGTIPIPDWANYVDVIALGGGGCGGQGGVYFLPGAPGGAAGHWATATWARGIDFSGAVVINVTVGTPGVYGVSNGGDSVVTIPGGSNIVVDPSFENDATWAGSAGVPTTVQAHSGTKSRQLTGTGATVQFVLTHDPTFSPALAGQTIYAEVWLRRHPSNTNSGNIHLRITARNASGVATGTQDLVTAVTAIPNNGWQKFSVSYVMPANTVDYYVDVLMLSDTPTGDVFYMDDVAVVKNPGHTITGGGGASAGGPDQFGQAAGNQDYLGLTYVGGEVSYGEGAVPGGGGTSGSDLFFGQGLNGARGGVWVVFREND